MSGKFIQEEYDKFMDDYNTQREACPKCGSLSYSTTLIGFIVDWGNPENYKDRNICNCMDCGDRHIMHDRISKASVRDGKLRDLGI